VAANRRWYELNTGQTITDNLPAHKVAGVRETIEAAGAVLWLLPPYSSDLASVPCMGLISKKWIPPEAA
jgi:transposase